MSGEMAVRPEVLYHHELLPPKANVPHPPETPSAAEAAAVDAAFVQDSDAHLLASMMGLYTGTILMHDVLVDHLTPSVDDSPIAAQNRDEDDDEDEERE